MKFILHWTSGGMPWQTIRAEQQIVVRDNDVGRSQTQTKVTLPRKNHRTNIKESQNSCRLASWHCEACMRACSALYSVDERGNLHEMSFDSILIKECMINSTYSFHSLCLFGTAEGNPCKCYPVNCYIKCTIFYPIITAHNHCSNGMFQNARIIFLFRPYSTLLQALFYPTQ